MYAEDPPELTSEASARKRRKTTSNAWENFDVQYAAPSDGEEVSNTIEYAICKQVNCPQPQVRFTGSTSNLWNHMLYHHPTLHQRLKEGILDDNTPSHQQTLDDLNVTKKALSVQRKNHLHKECARFVIKSAKPLTMPVSTCILYASLWIVA